MLTVHSLPLDWGGGCAGNSGLSVVRSFAGLPASDSLTAGWFPFPVDSLSRSIRSASRSDFRSFRSFRFFFFSFQLTRSGESGVDRFGMVVERRQEDDAKQLARV